MPAGLRLYLTLAAVAGFLLLLAGVSWKSYSLGASARDAYWQGLRAAEMDKRQAVTAATEAAGVRRAMSREAELSALQTTVDEYAEELAKRTDACVLDERDAVRLRNIR
jgi:hypothetical protein